MKIIDCGGDVRIADVADFDLVKTFECGQCFRWNADESGVYTGVAFGRAAQLRRDGSDVILAAPIDEFDAVWRSYFDLDRDYEQIRRQLCVSEFLSNAARFGAGIRILNQEPWEALCSFIISQNNHIPRIKSIIDRLCAMFGEPIEFRGNVHYSFPSAERLSRCGEAELAPLRCGYRAAYIIEAAKAVSGGSVDLDALRELEQGAARAELKQIHGVGDKVANCVLLFGLHMLDTFPVDVWIKRVLAKHCASDFDIASLSPYAGVAQQYMFYYIRNHVV